MPFSYALASAALTTPMSHEKVRNSVGSKVAMDIGAGVYSDAHMGI